MECMDGTLNLNGGDDIRLPFRPRDGGRCVKRSHGSSFVTIAAFLIDGPKTREWLCFGANDLNLFSQARLIVFELNDQMRVRGSRGFECFF